PGGLRAALQDEPPWWARGAIAAFAAVVVLVTVVSAVLGVNGSPPRTPGGTAGVPAGITTAGPSGTRGAGSAGTRRPATADAGGAGTPAGGAGSVALAAREGRFRTVPREAVEAARVEGAARLGLPPDGVRHHLVGAEPGRVELGIASLDGERTVTVVVV